MVFAGALLLISCGKHSSKNYISLAGRTQGTSYHITYCSADKVNYQKEIDSLLAEFDTTFSTYNRQSLITSVNQSARPVEVNDQFVYLFNVAKEVFRISDDIFDPTVGPLVNAWGFGPEVKLKVDSSKIDSLLEFVGFDKVRLENNRVIKEDSRIYLDVNGIAQGYAVDLIAGFFDYSGIKNYLVEIGGEVRVKGKNKEGDLWRIGVDKPKENNLIPGQDLQVILNLDNKSLSTSGNYRSFYEEDGIKYTHSINPRSGMPVRSKLLSTTVLNEDCIYADAYATAFMIMGLEESLKLSRQIKDLEAYFIYSGKNGSFQTAYTAGFEDMIQR